jgi:hypothetical protein
LRVLFFTIACIVGCPFIGAITVESLTNNLNNGVCKFDNDQLNAEAGGLGNTSSGADGTDSANVDDENGVLDSNMSLNMLLCTDNISKLGSVTSMDSLFLGADTPFPLPEVGGTDDSSCLSAAKFENSQEDSVCEVDLTNHDDSADDIDVDVAGTGGVVSVASFGALAASGADWEPLISKNAVEVVTPSSAVPSPAAVSDHRVLMRLI